MKKALTVVGALAAIALASNGVAYATSTSASSSGHSHRAQPASDLEALPNTCEASNLPPHTGFQVAPACVATEMGEVTDQNRNPSLLIVDFPDRVRSGQPFELKVSTRNLVRDRFLPAGQGGYYLESSFLNDDGLTRGHFHTACRLIDGEEAPTPDRQPVFVATEDGGGGSEPDTVTVRIPGIQGKGEAQCAVWAGDGSHRMPMMQFANQIPAFDSVRIDVNGSDGKRNNG